jgi:hypothetical protein
MPSQRLSAFLASGALASYAEASRHLQEVQRIFLDSAPPPLAQATRVKAVRAGTLHLSADNAAVAAKLRQLAPRLLTAIRGRVPEVNGIRVEVQASAASREPAKKPKKSVLSLETIGNFEKLAAGMPDTELKGAVAALVRRHRR